MKQQLFIKKKGQPLYHQLYEYLKQQILDGYLVHQERLLSVRKAKEAYQLSHTSIIKAYEQLLNEGLIEIKYKSGYYVCVNEQQRLLRQTMQQQQSLSLQDRIQYDLRSHSIDGSSFDIQIWNKCLKEALESKHMEQYGDAQGEISLRIALQKHAYTWRHVLCDIQQMIIGGSVQSLLFILAGLLPRHYKIVMEEHAFLQAQLVFQQYGFEVITIQRIQHGIDIQALQKIKPDVLYINVNSCGTNYSELTYQEKQALIQYTKEHQIMMIEDDHNGELNYRHETSASMQSKCNEQVCYIGSFSRLLLPSIRISYMILPTNIYQQYHALKSYYAPSSSKVEQIALTHYIIEGHMNRHIQRLQKHYYEKSIKFEQYLKQYFNDSIIILKEASFAYMIQSKQSINMESLIHEANQKGIKIEGKDHTLIIGFSSIQEDEMEKVIQYLAKLWIKYQI